MVLVQCQNRTFECRSTKLCKSEQQHAFGKQTWFGEEGMLQSLKVEMKPKQGWRDDMSDLDVVFLIRKGDHLGGMYTWSSLANDP